jgi:hypothetical protein
MHAAAVVEQGVSCQDIIIMTQSSTRTGIKNYFYANRASSIRAHIFPTKSEVKTEQIILAPV